MQPIYFTQSDCQKLHELLRERSFRSASHPTDDFLASELARARVVEPEEVPADVVTMNSQVRFKDIDTGEHLTYWLTFPENADPFENRISVLSPVGSALIGYRAGDVFEVQTGPAARRLKVEEVLHQPEANGVYA